MTFLADIFYAENKSLSSLSDFIESSTYVFLAFVNAFIALFYMCLSTAITNCLFSSAVAIIYDFMALLLLIIDAY